MNSTGKEIPPMKLLPHQAALVETFFSPPSKRIILLRGDVGFGKSVALVALSVRLLRERPTARVLFLVPAAMRFQIVATLHSEGIPCLIVDRYRFREMLDSTTGGEFWPSGVVSVLSLDFAKQTDIRESLAQTHWDLVVAEEGHWIRGARADALRRIGASADRIVLTVLPNLDPPDVFSVDDATVVEWQRDRIIDVDGKPLNAVPRPVLHELPFNLSAAELSLRATVHDLCRTLGVRKTTERFRAIMFLRSLESSPAALEGALQKFAASLTEADDLEQSLESIGEELPDEALANKMDSSTDERAAEDARRALQEVSAIAEDSKFSAFVQLLDHLLEVQTPSRRICVLTPFRSTQFYLAAEIEARGTACHLLHGGMPPEDRIRSLTLFSNGGGILLATTTVMTEGLDLAEVTDLILYDIPGSPNTLHQVLGRFDRFGRLNQLHIHVFTPSNIPDCSIAATVALLRDLLTFQAGPESSH